MLELQSGILHAEGKDYTSAYSYFFEAFEDSSSQGDEEGALVAFKYMLLCKVMLNLVSVAFAPSKCGFLIVDVALIVIVGGCDIAVDD